MDGDLDELIDALTVAYKAQQAMSCKNTIRILDIICGLMYNIKNINKGELQ